MEKLRIALVGAGVIGRRHMELLAESSECALVAIVDPMPTAPSIAKAAGVPLYQSLRELFAAQGVDGAIIATPNALHVDNALDCITAGVAALIEKPIAHTVDEGRRLCQAVDRTNASVLIGHHRAHSPILAAAREIVTQGRLGSLVAVTGSAMFYKPANYFDEAPWRRQAGGGPILINLIHEIGNLRSLCGEIVEVQALASSATRRHAVEDTVAINLCFANGALGSFMLSDTAASARSWEQTSRENTAYATYPDEDCYVVVGTQGSLAIPTMRLKLYANPQDRSWWKPMASSIEPVDRSDPLVHQLAHFCAVIRGEATPLVNARDGLQNLLITDAIAEAARTGTVVRTASATEVAIA